MNKVDFMTKFNLVLNSLSISSIQKKALNSMFSSLVDIIFNNKENNQTKIDSITANLNALTNLIEDNNTEIAKIGNIEKLTEKATIKDVILAVNKIIYQLSEINIIKISDDNIKTKPPECNEQQYNIA